MCRSALGGVQLKCAVRPEGLRSPRLFSFCLDELIAGLNSTGIGCSIGGRTVNNVPVNQCVGKSFKDL